MRDRGEYPLVLYSELDKLTPLANLENAPYFCKNREIIPQINVHTVAHLFEIVPHRNKQLLVFPFPVVKTPHQFQTLVLLPLPNRSDNWPRLLEDLPIAQTVALGIFEINNKK